MDTKVSFRGYMAWNYDREEQDLDRMSEQGWEFVGNTFNGWIYLKKQYIPGTPEEEYEIYTDSESLAELLKRWKKLAYLLSALTSSLLGLYVALGINAGYLSPVLIIIYVGMLCWIQWGIRQLKRKLLGDGIN